jgi:RNA polymerase sigma factor (sigma-70 family)
VSGVAFQASVRDDGFEAFYLTHASNVYRFSLSLVGNPADAEDVAQATFLNAFQALGNGQRPREPQAWLRAIARNVSHERHRRAQCRPRETTLVDVTTPGGEEPPIRATDIRNGLLGLPKDQRAALIRHEFQGQPYAEIGDALGLTRAGVQSLLVRARRNLREQLDEGVTCHQARRDAAGESSRPAGATGRRAVLAHLRHCEACSTRVRRRPLSLLTPALGLLKPSWLRTVLVRAKNASLGAEAAAAPATMIGKAATVILTGVLAGGVLSQTDTRHHRRQQAQRSATAASTSPVADAGERSAGAVVSSPGAARLRASRSSTGIALSPRRLRSESPVPPARSAVSAAPAPPARAGYLTATSRVESAAGAPPANLAPRWTGEDGLSATSPEAAEAPSPGGTAVPSEAAVGSATVQSTDRQATGSGGSGGAAAGIPGQPWPSEDSRGNSAGHSNAANAPGHTQANGHGNAASAPGHADGNGNSNADLFGGPPGQSADHGNAASAPGHADGNGNSNADLFGGPPGQSADHGNAASAPGHADGNGNSNADPFGGPPGQSADHGNAASAPGQTQAAEIGNGNGNPGPSGDAPGQSPGHGTDASPATGGGPKQGQAGAPSSGQAGPSAGSPADPDGAVDQGGPTGDQGRGNDPSGGGNGGDPSTSGGAGGPNSPGGSMGPGGGNPSTTGGPENGVDPGQQAHGQSKP